MKCHKSVVASTYVYTQVVRGLGIIMHMQVPLGIQLKNENILEENMMDASVNCVLTLHLSLFNPFRKQMEKAAEKKKEW